MMKYNPNSANYHEVIPRVNAVADKIIHEIVRAHGCRFKRKAILDMALGDFLAMCIPNTIKFDVRYMGQHAADASGKTFLENNICI